MHRAGLQNFRGLKLSFDDTGHADIRRVNIPDRYSTELLFGGIGTIGSGGNYALSAARALINHSSLSAAEIVRHSLDIAGEICVYSNRNIVIEELS